MHFIYWMGINELGGHISEIPLKLSSSKTKCFTMNVFPLKVYSPYSASVENYSHLNSASVSLAFVVQGVLTARMTLWSQDSGSSKHECFDRVNGSVYQS